MAGYLGLDALGLELARQAIHAGREHAEPPSEQEHVRFSGKRAVAPQQGDGDREAAGAEAQTRCVAILVCGQRRGWVAVSASGPCNHLSHCPLFQPERPFVTSVTCAPFVPDLAGSSPDPLLPVVFFRIIARLRLDTRTQQTLMPLVLFLPLVSLAIYLIPIYLLRRKAYARAQDYFVSSEHSPPSVIRNSSIAYALKMATFGPFFVWGASGDFWPAIIYSTFFGLGVCLIYMVRRPMLAFMESALHGDRSITVHDFIARQHGNDPRVRLFASCLTVFAILALVIGEALVVATFLKPILSDNAVLTSVFVSAFLALMASYAMLSGNSGVMRSAQSQLGMLYLGLFGSTALLLYLLISALRPMSPHSTFAMVFVAACCAVMPFYRRSVYVDTSPIRTAKKA